MSYKSEQRIGSHNSWSFKKVKQWYVKLLFWTAKCQKVNIFEQYSFGVRCFDLRLRYNHRKKIFETSHGLATYVGGEDWKHDIRWLDKRAEYSMKQQNGAPVYCRVLLETKNFDEEEKTAFIDICKWLEENYTHLIFFGGFPSRHWREYIYHFRAVEPTIEDKYSSVIPPKIRGLWPWLYAHTHNKENVELPAQCQYLYIDFLDNVLP